VVLSSYRDSAGILTIGVGHTAAAGAPKPHPGLMFTLDQAIRLFREDIRRYEAGVEQAVTVPLKQYEFDALVSFHFNTGAITRAVITRHLNAGDKNKAAAAFMNWTMAGGEKGALTDRRNAERAMFACGDFGNIASVLVYDRYPGPVRAVSTASLLGKPLVISPPQTDHPLPPTRSRQRWRGILAAWQSQGPQQRPFSLEHDDEGLPYILGQFCPGHAGASGRGRILADGIRLGGLAAAAICAVGDCQRQRCQYRPALCYDDADWAGAMSIVTTIIAAIVSNKFVAGLAAGAIAMLGAWLAGRRKGRRAELAKQAAARRRQQKTRQSVETTVAGRTDDENRKRLRGSAK